MMQMLNDRLKIGGGSYVSEHLYTWQLAELFKFCHPMPCLAKTFVHQQKHKQRNRQLRSGDGSGEAAEARQLSLARKVRGILINIRDPVDRFRSAFDWHLLRVCSRHGVRMSNEGM